LERTVRDKKACKPRWGEKITVLKTFLKSSLNYLSINTKNTTIFGTARQKSSVKV